MSKQWILIANGSIAQVWGRDGPHEPLFSIETIENPQGRPKGRELARDRQGHGISDQRSSAVRFEPRTDPRHKVHQQFARALSQYLDEALIARKFEHLWLLASSPLFGEIKSSLSPAVVKRLTLEQESDYTSLDPAALEVQLGQLRKVHL